MMPPELLHTSRSGLIMYMFPSLRSVLGTGKDDMDRREFLDKLHQHLSGEIQRQSERDFPRGSVRNGIINDLNVNQMSVEEICFYFCAFLVCPPEKEHFNLSCESLVLT